MAILVIGGVLFGAVLGRFFKIFVLVPASALSVILVLASPVSPEQSILLSLLEIFVLITALQVGYVIGLVTGIAAPELDGRGAWRHKIQTAASRSYHIH